MTTRILTIALTIVMAATVLTASRAAFADEATLRDQARLDFSMAETMDEPEPFRLFEGVDITFTPGVWLMRMRGQISLGPSPSARLINVETELDLRDLQPTFLGELEIRKHEVFSLLFTGFDFSSSGSGTFPLAGTFGPLTLTPGETYTSEFSLSSFSAELGVGMFRPFSALEDSPLDFKLTPMFVARYLDADITVMSGATTATGGGEWMATLLGLRLEADIVPRSRLFLIHSFKIDASLALGPVLGGDGGFMYQVRAGFSTYFTENIAFTFGYRLLDLDVEDGPLKIDTPIAGLFIGGAIRF